MILASRSPRRIELLAEAGIEARPVPADIDESALPGERAHELVRRLALAKASHVARAEAVPGEMVLAADTVVYLDGVLDDQILGKPRDADDARRMLRLLSGRVHHVATGVALVEALGDGSVRAGAFDAVTDVEFYELTDEEIDRYVETGSPLDKAGAYGIQDPGGRMLVKRIDGDYYNVVGLPIAETLRFAAALEGRWSTEG